MLDNDSIFKMMLQEYSVYDSGFLTIGICKPELEAFTRVFKSDVMNNSRILNFYEMCKNGVTGLTLSSEPLLFSAMKNVCIDVRLKWLHKFLTKINSPDFFKSNIGKAILTQFYESSNDKLTADFQMQMKYKNSILILQYVGIKLLMSELQIDERLEKHFESFKFRNN